MIDYLEVWNECVQNAKNKLSKNAGGYQIIKGSVLKEAQKAYCAIVISSSS
jgi:hypothetical protein